MLTTLKLDEGAKLEFGVQITGASGNPDARFIIEGEKYSILIPCRSVNEGIEVEIPALKGLFNAGEYSARLEVVIENKLYTPLNESIVFEPSVAIESKIKPVTVKESVKIGKITVKRDPVINENLLRKTHAAMIIAKSVGHQPDGGDSPEKIINQSLKKVDAKKLSSEQIKAIQDMLKLAEDTGIEYDVTLMPVIVEEKSKEVDQNGDTEISDDEIHSMIGDLSPEDFFDAYDADELQVLDDEGNVIAESLEEQQELNEVLSKVERIRAKIRFARGKTKRMAKLKLALKHSSSPATINKRARHLAVMALEKRLARGKAKSELTTNEKERIERIVQSRKAVISRMAMKLVAHVKQHERDRLAHHLTK